MHLTLGFVVEGNLHGEVLGDFVHELLAEKFVRHELAEVGHLASMVGRNTVFMLAVVFDVLGNGVADLRLAPGALLTVNDGAIFIFLRRPAILSNHLQIFDLKKVQVLLQL